MHGSEKCQLGQAMRVMVILSSLFECHFQVESQLSSVLRGGMLGMPRENIPGLVLYS
jgi:hypothetical protein